MLNEETTTFNLDDFNAHFVIKLLHYYTTADDYYKSYSGRETGRDRSTATAEKSVM